MIIKDFLDKYGRTIQNQVDITSRDLMDMADFLPEIPFRNYDDYEILTVKANKSRTLANVIGYEAEVPDRKAGTISVDTTSVIKFAKSHIYTEEDMKLMHKWERSVDGVSDTIKDYYFGTVTDLPSAIMDMMTRLTCEVLYTGAIAFTDPQTGSVVEATYTSDSNQFPSALTTTARWNQPSTATPVTNLRTHVRNIYNNVKARMPIATVMNSNTYEAMISTDSFKQQALAILGANISTDSNYLISPEDVASIFRRDAYPIPPIRIVDQAYESESADGTKTETRFVPDGYYFFTFPQQGERAMGPSAENDFASGIYTLFEEVSKVPPIDRAVAVATGLPYFPDTRLLAGRKVY